MDRTKCSGMLFEDVRVWEDVRALTTSNDNYVDLPTFSTEVCVANSSFAKRKSAHEKLYSDTALFLRKLWGAQDEQRGAGDEGASLNLLHCLYYTWFTDYIYIAAKEQLQVENLPSVPRDHRASECGMRFSAATQRSLYRCHCWAPFVGMRVRSRRDSTSCGTLRWVGVPYTVGYDDVLAAVTWITPPSHRVDACRAGCSPFFRGVLHGETLFAPEDTDNSTLESPGELEFIYDNSEDAALGAEVPQPRRLSVMRDIFAELPACVLWQFPGKLIGDVCTLAIPILLQKYVAYLTSESPTWGAGIALSLLLFFVQSVQSLALQKFYYISINGGLCYRSALTAVISEKCLLISSKFLVIPEMSVGRIINMVSTDTERANEFLQYCMYLWSSPLVLFFGIVLLYRFVGWCAFVSIVTICMTFPINAFVTRRIMRARGQLAKVTDARVKATNEFFSGIRIAKCMTWEPKFISEIEAIREKELKYVKELQTCRIALSFFSNAIPPILIASVFVLYTLTGNNLTPETVFPVISLLGIVRIPFLMLPMVFNLGAQFIISSARISSFLECENTSENVADVSVYNKAQQAKIGSLCEAAAVFEKTDITAFMPVKLPRAPKVVVSFVMRFMRYFFCCCDRCCLEKQYPPPTQVDEEQCSNDSLSITTTTNNNNTTTTTSNVAIIAANKEKKKKQKKSSNVEKEHSFQLVPKVLLTNISLELPMGKLTVIVGPTGSGKSTLLATLLGEYEATRGRVWAARSIAYVPQQPWIMNATLRENIIFFTPEDPAMLQEVVSVCQLAPDLKLLPAGLQTEIGEKGVNLSGGQKARVSLARAIYSNRELYLLDDPLSALDANIGKLILTDALLGTLRNKTRVLATHQLHALHHADYVVVMGNCTLRFFGSRKEFFSSSLSQEIFAQNEEEEEEGDKNEGAKEEEGANDVLDNSTEKHKGESVDLQQEDGADGVMMTSEEKAVGSVSWSTYMAYVRACGGVSVLVLVLVIFLLTEMLTLSCNVWLSMWSTRRFDFSTSTYLNVYILLIFCGAFSIPLRLSMIYRAMRCGSRNLHSLVLRSVSTGTTQFFDTTPLARIVNRFSKDIDRIDDALQSTIIFFFQVSYSVFSSFTLTVSSQPYVIIVVVPVLYLYYRLVVFYSASKREISRVGSTVKAPMLSLISGSLSGLSTIRAYGCAESIMKELLWRIDQVYASSFMENVANRWLGVRVDLLNSVIVFVVGLAGVIGTMTRLSSHDVALVSLSLTMAVTTTPLLNWLVRMASSMEADMNSVERIFYYTYNIDHEEMPEIALLSDAALNRESAAGANADTVVVEGCEEGRVLPVLGEMGMQKKGEKKGNEDAVEAGSIEFREVDMRYREGLPLVLKKVTFRIERRQKIGIVGRTGSGKSTLLQTFMRMVDICGGEIFVSGRPIRDYGLRELRRLFSMIPQDPVLFDGTVRSNLDPFCEATPEEVWRALEVVGMRQRVEAETGGIDSHVHEGGANYSVGQRQLLCLARALLRRGSSFILMDEATANIDDTLDQQIQRTVMTAFSAYTVITIAHRLHTVAAYNKIIVMDHGCVAELGTPRELIANPSSKLSELVAALGKEQAAKFKAALENASQF